MMISFPQVDKLPKLTLVEIQQYLESGLKVEHTPKTQNLYFRRIRQVG
ncbi:hypothetical protein H6G97_31810 [Nostoc flagelliforme FACHB-838]|uniref:Integrase n=1 Tax=Nostoc flagelliforme FACHB-838 TaxID=2692904 RepID=A0ABR8DX46_9NOSO|nr:hypothetical protein [Nostoc flagelliforme]MBD2533890.1 hypothetical protein [Nostoc flagelliforme FACHB-838]